MSNPKGRPRATTCRICGAPRSERAKNYALCDEHLIEHRRRENKRAWQKRKGLPSGAPEAAAVEPARVVVRVIGGRVEMDLGTLGKFLVAIAEGAAPLLPAVISPAPEAEPVTEAPASAALARRLAVISSDLSRVIVYDARPVEVRRLSEARYAAQMMALRDGGCVICVEE